MELDRMQIGEVAERTGLSLRTIRHYDEIGIVTPSARSVGGFRLYTESDIARLELVKKMKPLGLTLEEMSSLLEVLDQLDADDGSRAARADLLDRLAMYRSVAEERCLSLRAQLETAEGFARRLRREIQKQARTADKHQDTTQTSA